MKNKITLILGVICAAQTAALIYIFTFTMPMQKDGGWWVFKSPNEEILRWDLPDSRGHMVLTSFPGALCGVVYFPAQNPNQKSFSIDVGQSYVSTSTSYDGKEGARVLIVDKDGDGIPDIKSLKGSTRTLVKKLSFLETEN